MIWIKYKIWFESVHQVQSYDLNHFYRNPKKRLLIWLRTSLIRIKPVKFNIFIFFHGFLNPIQRGEYLHSSPKDNYMLGIWIKHAIILSCILSGNLITTIYHIHDVLRVFITAKSCSTLTKLSKALLTYHEQESYFQHACTSDDTFYNRVK